MTMTKKTKAAVPAIMPAPAAPPPPSLDMPAVYANHAHASWAGGVIRLTLGEQMGDQLQTRAAVIITAAQAAEVIGLLQQAEAALTPAASN